MAIRVFHADDHQTFRDGMRLILEREPDIEVVGSSGDTGEAFKMINKLKPDVALLDLSMPGGGVLAIVRRLRTELPSV
ncbi:MAG TPA: response regulator transcription factor, partial [Candidatus Binatia bacterium]|nr:response regulator transcription factor [Candidatus Binatia bacterium]